MATRFLSCYPKRRIEKRSPKYKYNARESKTLRCHHHKLLSRKREQARSPVRGYLADEALFGTRPGESQLMGASLRERGCLRISGSWTKVSVSLGRNCRLRAGNAVKCLMPETLSLFTKPPQPSSSHRGNQGFHRQRRAQQVPQASLRGRQPESPPWC